MGLVGLFLSLAAIIYALLDLCNILDQSSAASLQVPKLIPDPSSCDWFDTLAQTVLGLLDLTIDLARKTDLKMSTFCESRKSADLSLRFVPQCLF